MRSGFRTAWGIAGASVTRTMEPIATASPAGERLDPATARAPLLLRRGLWVGLVVVLTGVAAAWAWSWLCGTEAENPTPLPVIAAVPDFSLIERDGRTVTRADLLGQVWVADFIFANCSGPCPTLTARMRSIELALTEREPDVKLVSFTLDPLRDTPEVLQDYAKRFHADPKRWLFLTGNDEPAVHALVEKGFLLPVIPATETNPLIHSNYFVVVDRGGRIRAFHDGLDPNSKPRVLRDIRKLLRESAAP